MRDFISFEGRGGTAECLLVGAAAIVVWHEALFLFFAIPIAKIGGYEDLLEINLWASTLICGWAYASALIRRLRDAGRSPYWAIPCFAPFVGVAPWFIVVVLPSKWR